MINKYKYTSILIFLNVGDFGTKLVNDQKIREINEFRMIVHK